MLSQIQIHLVATASTLAYFLKQVTSGKPIAFLGMVGAGCLAYKDAMKTVKFFMF